VYVIELTPSLTAYLPNSLRTYGYNTLFGGVIRGLEFVMTGVIPGLYCAGGTANNSIFHVVDLSLNQAFIMGSGPYPMHETFLELGKNGEVYGISMHNGGLYLVSLDPNTLAVSATQITGDSKHSNLNSLPYLHSVYTLPDQIDGEQYDNFSTMPNVALTGLTINGVTAQDYCDGTGQQVYNCSPISINVTYNTEETQPCSYQVEIIPITPWCEAATIANPFYHQTEWLEGSVPLSYDIRNYYSQYSHSLYNQPGFYAVIVKTYDCCGNYSEKVGIIEVLQSIPPNLTLEFYDNTNANPSYPWFPASVNWTSPSNVGSASLQFKVSGTGNITGYNVTIDEIGSNANFSWSIGKYNKTISTNNISGIGNHNLNTLCFPASSWPSPPTIGNCNSANPSYSGYTGYFSYNNAQHSFGRTYAVTVSLLNPCSNAQTTGYIYVNSIGNRPQPTLLDDWDVGGDKIAVFPNPATEHLNVAVPFSASSVEMELCDLAGKILLQKTISAGDAAVHRLDVANFAKGMYLLKVRSESMKETKLVNIQ
jgi:hypothetical protein